MTEFSYSKQIFSRDTIHDVLESEEETGNLCADHVLAIGAFTAVSSDTSKAAHQRHGIILTIDNHTAQNGMHIPDDLIVVMFREFRKIMNGLFGQERVQTTLLMAILTNMENEVSDAADISTMMQDN